MFANLATPVTACPDEFVLLAMASGTLAMDQFASVDEHLDQCASCSQIIGALGVELSATLRSGLAHELRAGSKLKNYRLVALLGEGAHGQVWRAMDERLDREIAVKILHSELQRNVLLRERAEREARALAKLSHPNVVTVYSVEDTENVLFLTIEFVRGQTLREWLQATPAPSPRAVYGVLLDAARGLQAAHLAGLVHRDFKPDNVLVGDDGRTRVTDFGLAKTTLEQDSGSDSASLDDSPASLTLTGSIVGTPAYMPLEQLLGKVVDARADVFSFAVTLWEALFKTRPFVGETVGHLRAALSGEPIIVNSTVPKLLQQTLLRSLQADPAKRPADMTPIVVALEQALSPRSHATILSVSAAAIGVLAIAGFAFAMHASRATKAPCQSDGASPLLSVQVRRDIERTIQLLPRSQQPQLRLRVEALGVYQQQLNSESLRNCRATFVTHSQSMQALDLRGACLRRVEMTYARTVTTLRTSEYAVAARALALIDELPSADECADATRLSTSLGLPTDQAARALVARIEDDASAVDPLMTAGQFAAAVSRSGELLERADTAHWATLQARMQRLHAQALQRAGQFVLAAQQARAAVLIAERVRDDRTAAAAWLIYLAALGAQGQWDQSLASMDLADAAIRRWQDPRMLSTLAMIKGLALTNAGDLDAAEAALNMALNERERTSQPLSPVLSALGNLARARGRYDQALLHHQRALALDRIRLGDAHPDVAEDRHNIGGDLRRLRRYPEAREQYLLALQITRDSIGAGAAQTGLTENSLGLLGLESDSLADAAGRFERAREILQRLQHPELSLVLANSALVAIAQGNPAQAVRLSTDALALEQRAQPGSPLRDARISKVLGKALLAQHEPAQARVHLLRAIALCSAPGLQNVRDFADILEEARLLLPPDQPTATRSVRAPELTVRRGASITTDAPPTAAETPASSSPTQQVAARAESAPDAGSHRLSVPVQQPPVISGSGGYLPAQQWRSE